MEGPVLEEGRCWSAWADRACLRVQGLGHAKRRERDGLQDPLEGGHLSWVSRGVAGSSPPP